MANDNWQEQGSTLEFRNQKWENQSSNLLWTWIICPRCNRATDHAKEEFILITPYSFYCPHCGKIIDIIKNIQE